jgi:hypothetical protein
MHAEDDLSSWEVTRWWFNGHFFDSLNDLIRAWNADKDGMRSTFRMLRPAGAAKLFSNFMPRPGPKRGEKQPVGPISFEPYGRRCGCKGSGVDQLARVKHLSQPAAEKLQHYVHGNIELHACTCQHVRRICTAEFGLQYESVLGVSPATLFVYVAAGSVLRRATG